jgi:hypothetical protein
MDVKLAHKCHSLGSLVIGISAAVTIWIVSLVLLKSLFFKMKNLFSPSKSASYLRIFLFIFFMLEQNAISKTRSISLNGKWQIWFDLTARWQKEELVLEPANLSQVPQYPPTIGWDQMLEHGEQIPVPSTWEEKYPGYDGVAWYWREFEIPFEYREKFLRIKFWAVRHRAEVYLNQKLVGYNIEGFTPFEVNISDAVKYGAKNLLVVRVTDPGGGDNWRDYNPIPWGKVRLPDSHNFGGIWQDVELLITNRLYVDNIYIQPQENLETILVQTTLQNKGTDQEVELILHVIPRHQSATVKPVVEHKQNLNFTAKQPTVVENTLTIQNPNLWSPESSSRYNLNVTVQSSHKVFDTYLVPFGVRFFTEKDGGLYLNGKRIFFKCSISWGYYPKTIAYPTRDLAEREIKNAKFPPEMLAHTMRTLHLAICPLPSVAYSDEEVFIQISLINETNLSGVHVLEVQVTDPNKNVIFTDMKKVLIKGRRETFIESLMEFCIGLNGKSGYYHIQAELKRNEGIIAQEERDVFVQNIIDLNLPECNSYYVDGGNIIPYYLDERRTFWYPWNQKFSHFHKDNLIFLLHRYTGKKISYVLDMVYRGDANLI